MDAQERIAELETAVAARDAIIAEQARRIAEQQARINELETQVILLIEQVKLLTEKLSQNSRNSHRPPSSDPPGQRGGGGAEQGQGKRKKKSKRKRGGQPGHRGHHRGLLPESSVNEFKDYYPSQCENCWEALPNVPDSDATRFQVTEVPAILPHTTEYRCHAVLCRCGYLTRGCFGEDVPSSPFGPRLMSLIGLFSGVYHLSRRKTVSLLGDVLGVRISLGAVSSVEARVSLAVEPAVTEAWTRVEGAGVKHTDGTSWLQAGALLSVWTIATAMVTVFKIVKDASKATLKPLYGALGGILVSDRATALNFWAMERRQVCWAHLLRTFVSFSERDGPMGAIGRELLDYTGLVFEYWHAFKDGTLSRAAFRASMRPVQTGIEEVLERAVALGIKRLSGSCKNLLEHRLALWTFVDQDGVEPTNNHAERELRAFVLWRKRSFGSQSERGNLFAERLMTVAHTARKQNKNVLSFLTGCCEAALSGGQTPSLFAAPTSSAVA